MDKIWMGIGFLGQLIFGSRFVIQWLYSERKKQSVIPMVFWYLSIVGNLLLLSYACAKKDPVFIIGNLFNTIIYVRNIVLSKNQKLLED